MKQYKAKRDFVSPVFGNVFPGDPLMLSDGQAKHFAEIGLINPEPIADETPTDETPTDETPSDEQPELDKDGLPWDERIHSSNHKLTKEGLWQRRRGVTDEEFAVVVAELMPEPDANPETEETLG